MLDLCHVFSSFFLFIEHPLKMWKAFLGCRLYGNRPWAGFDLEAEFAGFPCFPCFSRAALIITLLGLEWDKFIITSSPLSLLNSAWSNLSSDLLSWFKYHLLRNFSLKILSQVMILLSYYLTKALISGYYYWLVYSFIPAFCCSPITIQI